MNDEKWNEAVKAIEIYKDREGHCDVPAKHKEGDVNLGDWLNVQRQAYKSGKLPQERVAQIESIGIKWNPRDEKWNKSIKVLEEFAAQQGQGHGDAPKAHEEGKESLGDWVGQQRSDYREGRP